MALVPHLFRGPGPYPAGACGALSNSRFLSPYQGPKVSRTASLPSGLSPGLHRAWDGCGVRAGSRVPKAVGVPEERMRSPTRTRRDASLWAAVWSQVLLRTAAWPTTAQQDGPCSGTPRVTIART